MQRSSIEIREVWLKETPTARPMLAPFASCVECSASICETASLLYATFAGLFRAWLCGPVVSGRCLAMVVISTLQLLA